MKKIKLNHQTQRIYIDSMEHSLPWKDYSYSAGQEFLAFMEPKGSLPCSQRQHLLPWVSPSLHILFLSDPFSNILPPVPPSKVVSSLEVFQPKFCSSFHPLPLSLTHSHTQSEGHKMLSWKSQSHNAVVSSPTPYYIEVFSSNSVHGLI
jgi:hypothetical protein